MNLSPLVWTLVAFLNLFSAAAWSEDIQFSENELAQETVLPKFDPSEAVKQRNIVTANKIEAGGYFGWNFTEPIYNPMKYGVWLGYHWSEFSGIYLNYTSWAQGLNTQYTDQLRSGNLQVKFERAPKLLSSTFLNYEMRVYYGKISLTKQSVMNLSLYPILGLGMNSYSHKSYYGANAGLGWKLYFTKYLALRTDFYLQFAQAPNPTSAGTKLVTDPDPSQASDFTDKSYIGTHFDLGLTALF